LHILTQYTDRDLTVTDISATGNLLHIAQSCDLQFLQEQNDMSMPHFLMSAASLFVPKQKYKSPVAIRLKGKTKEENYV